MSVRKRIETLERNLGSKESKRCPTCQSWKPEWIVVESDDDPRLGEPRYQCPDCGWQPEGIGRMVVRLEYEQRTLT